MSVVLRGGPEFKARLKAIQQFWKPAAKAWAQTDKQLMEQTVPWGKNHHEGTPRLRESFGVGRANQKSIKVKGYYTAYFVDAGVKPHSLVSRKARPTGRASRAVFTYFSRKTHPGYRARPFRHRLAAEALRREPLTKQVIDLWNKAA